MSKLQLEAGILVFSLEFSCPLLGDGIYIIHDCNTKLVPVTCLFKKMIGYTVFIHLTLFGSFNANYMFVMEY